MFAHTDEVLLQLLGAGLVPIITHPERHGQLRHRPDDLARWIGFGCYVQVTASSVTGLLDKSIDRAKGRGQRVKGKGEVRGQRGKTEAKGQKGQKAAAHA